MLTRAPSLASATKARERPRQSHLIGLVLLVAALLRFPAFGYGVISDDEAIYDAMGRVISAGGVMYRDTVDHKPPGLAYTYSAAQRLAEAVGSTPGAGGMPIVHLFGLLAVLGTCLALFGIARRLVGDVPAFLPPLLYAAASAAKNPVDGLAVNGELLMNLPAAFAVLAAVEAGARERHRRLLLDLAAGALCAVAVLYKYQAALVLFAFPFLFLQPPRPRWQEAGRRLACWVLGFLAPLGLVVAAFAQRGALSEALRWGLEYNATYLAQGPGLLWSLRRLGMAVLGVVLPAVVLYACGGWALFRLLGRSPVDYVRCGPFLAAWSAFALLATSLGGRFFGHYFLQAELPLSLLAAGPAARLGPRRLAAALGLPALVFFAVAAFPNLVRPMLYAAEPDYETLGREIAARTSPGDTIWVWGNVPQLYHAADRLHGVRFSFCNYLTGLSPGTPSEYDATVDPQASAEQSAWPLVIEDLDRKRPMLVIDTAAAGMKSYGKFPIKHFPVLARYLDAHYRLEASVNKVALYPSERLSKPRSEGCATNPRNVHGLRRRPVMTDEHRTGTSGDLDGASCYDFDPVMRHLRSTVVMVILVCAGASVASAQSAAPTRSGLTDLSRSLQELVARVGPSVVQIFVTGYAPPDDEERTATGEPMLERSSGSGVIVDPDGYIVTNAHVVEDATRIEVELPFDTTGGKPGRSIIKRRGRMVGAQVVAIDHETDLAVIKVEVRGLSPLPFGDSDALRPGQLVMAFGSPLGLSASVSMGVVSAVARQLEPDDPMIYIQTDAPINPGNSGGALVDMDGKLVGINTLIYSQSGGNEGIGFAAPSNIVRNIFTQIRKTGRVRRGQIGVNAQTITPMLAEALGFAMDAGVVLADVTPDGPAAKAGLQPGDVVLSLDGKEMENGRQFRINIYTRSVGEEVAVEVRRGARTLTMRVPVSERDNDSARLEELIGPQQVIRPLGIVAIDLTPPVAELVGDLRIRAGAVVARVTAEAPYSQQGSLEAGDVIHAVNGKVITNVDELKKVMATFKPGAAIALQVERDSTLMYLAFRVEVTR